MISSGPISIIVPTEARAARAGMLRRALDSLRAQEGAVAAPIVVVNGTRSDPGLVADLRGCRDVRVVFRAEGSIPLALAAGRSHVETRYFGVLDDDDEYLPRTLAVRAKVLDDDAAVDVVVTRGFLEYDGVDFLHPPTVEGLDGDPLTGLIENRWLNSCAALYRTDRFDAETLAGLPKFLEWTYLAVRIGLESRIAFVAEPGFRCHRTTPHSVSRSRDFVVGCPGALRRICALDAPPRIRRHFRDALVNALHDASATELAGGRRVAAWRYHLETLAHWRGLRHLSYTRHLLAPRSSAARR